jgi:hypothetical protein
MADHLTEEQGVAIRAAPQALGETLSTLVPVEEALRLAMVAGGFTDMLMAGAHSGGAAALIDAANAELAEVGVHIVPVRRHRSSGVITLMSKGPILSPLRSEVLAKSLTSYRHRIAVAVLLRGSWMLSVFEIPVVLRLLWEPALTRRLAYCNDSTTSQLVVDHCRFHCVAR